MGVAEGGTFTLLAKPNGSLWTWGEPHLGRIFEQGQFPLPIEIPGFERVRGIAVGRDQALVIQEDGSSSLDGVTTRPTRSPERGRTSMGLSQLRAFRR